MTLIEHYYTIIHKYVCTHNLHFLKALKWERITLAYKYNERINYLVHQD